MYRCKDVKNKPLECFISFLISCASFADSSSDRNEGFDSFLDFGIINRL